MKKVKSLLAVLLVAVMFLASAPNVNAAEDTIDTSQEVQFTIHKYRDINENDKNIIGNTTDGSEVNIDFTDYVPLENVKFKMYKTNILQEPGKRAEMPSAETVSKNKSTYGITTATYTITTDQNGVATQTVASTNQGIYLVEEVENPAIKNENELGKPFLVSLPTTTKEGTGWNYDVHAYPKNTVVGGPDIDKEVLGANEDSGKFGVNIGDDVIWRITTDISADLYFVDEDGKESNAKKFEITDILNKALTYKSIAFKTSIGNGTPVELDLDDDDYGVSRSADGDNTKMVFTLEPSGMKKVKQAQDAKATNFMVEVTTTVNANALVVDEVTNDAKLVYENNLGIEFEKDTKDKNPTDPEKPGVQTGSTGFTKYAAGETPSKLKGVTFAIADSEANAKAGKYIRKDASGNIYFPGHADYNKYSDYTVTTDDDGIVEFVGLKYTITATTDTTSYWVVETDTADGYQLLASPYKVEVGANTNLGNLVGSVSIYNNKKFALPNTGGMGTVIFSVAGIALMGSALLIIKKSKKSKAE